VEYWTYIGELIAGFVYLIVGARLYALSLRTGEACDRLLSVSFLFWALGYLSYDVPFALAGEESLVSPAFSFAWRPLTYLGTFTLAIFTRRLFRSQERWSAWLVAGVAGCMIVGLAGSAWMGDWGGFSPLSNPWYWLEQVGRTAPFIWIGTEGLAQYRKARKRQRLGLCDALLCNRFLLWGVVGVLWALLELVVVPQDIVYESTGQWSDSLGMFLGWLEFVPVAMIWLVFFPPAFYRNWITKLTAVADTTSEGSAHGG
jgi:hypothetical protein